MPGLSDREQLTAVVFDALDVEGLQGRCDDVAYMVDRLYTNAR